MTATGTTGQRIVGAILQKTPGARPMRPIASLASPTARASVLAAPGAATILAIPLPRRSLRPAPTTGAAQVARLAPGAIRPLARAIAAPVGDRVAVVAGMVAEVAAVAAARLAAARATGSPTDAPTTTGSASG